MRAREHRDRGRRRPRAKPEGADLLASLGGRLHFGLGLPKRTSSARLLANIPALALWRSTVEALDPRRTFVHRLVREAGLR